MLKEAEQVKAAEAAQANATGGVQNTEPDPKEQMIVRDPKCLIPDSNRVDWKRWAPGGGRVPGTGQENHVLDVGTIIDRYGYPTGNYISPVGTPYGQRALPYYENPYAYHVYEVTRPIEGVTSSQIEPAFKQPGLGIQYKLPKNIQYLLNNHFGEEIVK